MPNFAFSKHTLEQIVLRGLTTDVVEAVLTNPDKIVKEEGDQTIYQAVVQRDGKDYLLRIFVNSAKTPNLVKTVYITSKISKYQ